MLNKNLSLSIAFFCIASTNTNSGYPAQTGYQVQPNEDLLRREKFYTLQKRGDELLALQNKLIEPGTVTIPRTCAAGSATGLVTAVYGLIQGNGYMVAGGVLAFFGLGALAKGTSDREQEKLDNVSEQIKQNSDAIAKV